MDEIQVTQTDTGQVTNIYTLDENGTYDGAVLQVPFADWGVDTVTITTGSTYVLNA